ncbi:MAG: hypothetical protein KGS44_11355 [Alphaproteobacteria bacterium]|nr:hypothetical protein [Alphaproteobacteria bacterium]
MEPITKIQSLSSTHVTITRGSDPVEDEKIPGALRARIAAANPHPAQIRPAARKSADNGQARYGAMEACDAEPLWAPTQIATPQEGHSDIGGTGQRRTRGRARVAL